MVKVKLNILLQTVINNRELQRQNRPTQPPISCSSCDSLINVATEFHEMLLDPNFHLENRSGKLIKVLDNHRDEIKFS